MKHSICVAVLWMGCLSSQDLADPVQVKCGDQVIDVDVGHAAPFFGDIDGDGKPDLIVGQYGQGRARVYRNVGAKGDPRFERFEWFHAGGQVAEVWTN